MPFSPSQRGRVVAAALTVAAASCLVLTDAFPATSAPPWFPRVVNGTAGPDVLDLSTSTRAVVVHGKGGDDAITGSDYRDRLDGGTGNDTIKGGPRADLIAGGPGSDTFVLAPGQLPGTPLATGLGVERIVNFAGAGVSGAGDQDRLDIRPFGPGAQVQFLRYAKLGKLTARKVQVYRVVTGGGSVGGHLALTMKIGTARLDSADVVSTPATPTNSAPVLAASDRDGSVTQLPAMGGTRTDTGSIAFSDAEPAQTHSVTTAPVSAHPLGTFDGEVTADTGGGGSLTWTYAVANDELRHLGAGQSMQEKFQVTLSDSATPTPGTAMAEVSVTQHGVNDAPVASGSLTDQGLTARAAASWALPAGTFTDPDDGDSLTLSATGSGGALPEWLTFTPATRTFNASPKDDDIGSHTIQVTVTDSHGASISATFVVTVAAAPNESPVIGTSGLTGSVTQVIPTGQTLVDSGSIGFTDADTTQTHTVMVTPVGSPDGTLDAQVSSDSGGSGSIAWSYTVDNEKLRHLGGGATSPESFVVTLSDGTATTQTTVAVTEHGVNDNPVTTTTLSDQTIPAGSPSGWNIPADLFTDPDDGDTVTRTAVTTGTAALPGWLTFTDATGQFAANPVKADAGIITIDVIGTDGAATATASYDVTVTAPPNNAPVAVTDNLTWNVPDHPRFAPTSDEISFNVLTNDTDADADALVGSGGGTWKIDGDPQAAGTFSVAADGTLTMNSGTDPLGPVQQLVHGESWPATLSYSVSDGTESTTGTVKVTVTGGLDQVVVLGQYSGPPNSGAVNFFDPEPIVFDNRGCFVDPEGPWLQNSWTATSSVVVYPDPAFVANKNVNVVTTPANGWGFNTQVGVKITIFPQNGKPAVSQELSFFIGDLDGHTPMTATCGEQSHRPYAPEVHGLVIDMHDGPGPVTAGNVLTDVTEPDGQSVTAGGYGYIGDVANPYGTYRVNVDGSVTVTMSADNPLPEGQQWNGNVRYRAVDSDGNMTVGPLFLEVVGAGA